MLTNWPKYVITDMVKAWMAHDAALGLKTPTDIDAAMVMGRYTLGHLDNILWLNQIDGCQIIRPAGMQ